MSTLFKKPDGSFVYVDEQYAQAARQKGYTPATPAQLEASKQTGQAFVEGAVRGGLLGGGDAVTVPFLEGYTGRPEAQVRQEVRLRKQENPVAAGGGEIAGAVGTSLVTGGGASALVGGGVKGAAFEGGLYGLGTMVSESALENTPLTSERLAVGFLGGALAGGGAQAGFTALGKGVSLGVSKLGGQGIKDTLGKAADELEWRALSEGNKRWRDQNEPFKDTILKFARDKGILGTMDAALDSKTVQKAQAVASDYATKISGQMDDLERMVPLKNNDKLRMELVNFVEQRLDDEFGMNPAFHETLKPIKAMTESIANERGHTWKSVWDFQSALFKDTPVTGLSPAAAQAREETRQAVRDFVFDTVAAGANMPPGLAASMRKTGLEARAALAITKAIANRASSIESSGGVAGLGSLKSLGVGAMTGFVTGNPLAALAGAVAETQIRKRGGFLGATALRALADSSVTKGVTGNLQRHIGTILATAPEILGAYRYPLAQAAAQGADALLAEHVRLASGPTGQDYLARTALPVETPEETDAAGQRLAVLDAIARAQDGSDVDRAIDGLFGSAPGRRGSTSAPISAKDFDKYKQSLLADLTQPERVFEAISPELRASAPATVTEAAAKALQARQFLFSKMPKNPYEGMPESVAPPWQPSAADLDRFSRYKEAVEQPARVLKNMSNGYIAPEQLEALRAVYPAIYADLQQKIGERLAMWNKPLSYQQRLAFSAIVGPTALGMTPQQVQVLQQTQALATSPQNVQGGSVKRPDGRQDVNEAQMETESEKLEAR